jgi:hypothetical protein
MGRVLIAALTCVLLALAVRVWLAGQAERCMATRWIEPEDGVQPADPWTTALTLDELRRRQGVTPITDVSRLRLDVTEQEKDAWMEALGERDGSDSCGRG